MNILIANDDGINSQGIYELAKALSSVGKIYVCAPHVQRSATSHSISIREHLEVKRVEFENAEMAFEITGTPADCVKLGMKVLKDLEIDIDIVFSGINHGGNMGKDTLYSGTVAAAIEGGICGKPSVAVSVDNHEAKHFDFACELAVDCAKKAYGKLMPGNVLNINVPDLPYDEIKGVKFTTLGRRDYMPWFQLMSGIEGDADNVSLKYKYAGVPVVEQGNEDLDVIAMGNGYASITPLMYDLTDYSLVEEIKKWGLGQC